MVFNPNIPQPTDYLSVSQQDLLGNNTALQAWSTVDHYSFSDLTANVGKHTKVTLPFLASGPSTAVGEDAIYTKKVSGVPEVFIRKENNGAEIQLTSGNSINPARAYVNFNGTTGAILGTASNVSSVTVNSVGNYTVNLSITQPTATYCVLISVEAVSPAANWTYIYGTRTTTSFNINVYNNGSVLNPTSVSATILGQ